MYIQRASRLCPHARHLQARPAISQQKTLARPSHVAPASYGTGSRSRYYLIVTKNGTSPGTKVSALASKAARTRGRILDATAYVLSIKGYAGTRLADVAEHAQVQAPAIYYHFPSRDDLIEEVIYAGIAEMRAQLHGVLDRLQPTTTPLDRILVAVETHLRHELEISHHTTAFIRNAGQIPERLRTRQRAEEIAYGRIWQQLFESARAAGQIRSDLDIHHAQLLVIGALSWAAEWFDPRRNSVESIVATAQHLVRHGLDGQQERRDVTVARPSLEPVASELNVDLSQKPGGHRRGRN